MPMLSAEPLPKAVVQLVEDESILRDSTGPHGRRPFRRRAFRRSAVARSRARLSGEYKAAGLAPEVGREILARRALDLDFPLVVEALGLGAVAQPRDVMTFLPRWLRRQFPCAVIAPV
jgi:hypothetical protein